MGRKLRCRVCGEPLVCAACGHEQTKTKKLGVQFNVLLNEEAKLELERQAKEAGLTVSEFARRKLLSGSDEERKKGAG